MTWSLRKRFLLTSAAASAAALMAAGVFLYLIFVHDIRERVHAEIHHNLMQLIDGLNVDGNGRVVGPQAMSDPRFREPASGLYWEVYTKDGQTLASRSLWDSTLQKSSPAWTAIEEPLDVIGPFEEPILLHARIINLGEGKAQQQLRVMMAINESEIREPSRRFAILLAISLAALALAMFLVSAAQIGLVMSPLNLLRSAVREIRDGTQSRVPEGYPVEMEPIVAKLNDLLQQKEQTVENARARAANFAHSLKTPLTIIDTQLAEIRDRGFSSLARDLSQQTGQIRRHVDRELARARMASGHGEPLPDIGAVLHEVTNTMRQLPRGRDIAFEVDAPSRQALRMDKEDFIELVGNILDNARKWAKSRTLIRVEKAAGGLRLTVSDDGPGIPEGDLEMIAERGRRLDETMEGTGIGLAIAKDIADAYQLQTSFRRSALGGLEVAVIFPL